MFLFVKLAKMERFSDVLPLDDFLVYPCSSFIFLVLLSLFFLINKFSFPLLGLSFFRGFFFFELIFRRLINLIFGISLS